MDSAPDSDGAARPTRTTTTATGRARPPIIQLNAEAAPTIVATQQITHFDGDRPFNHPRLASAAGDYVGRRTFASTHRGPEHHERVRDGRSTRRGKVVPLTGKSLNGDNQVYDANGQLQPVLNVGQNDGNNHGASEMHFIGTDAHGRRPLPRRLPPQQQRLVRLRPERHEDGDRRTTSTQDWQTLFARPANIGRPTIAVTGATTATCCAAKGNNRPPEIGIQCVALDTTTGKILNKAIVAPSQPDQKVYMNQPTITYLGNGTCGLGVVMSDGQGRNRNGHFLGSNTSMAYTIDCNTLKIKNTQTGGRPVPAPRDDDRARSSATRARPSWARSAARAPAPAARACSSSASTRTA